MFKFVKFVELPVADQNRAVSFYTEKLGFKVAQDSPYKEEWRWIELEVPGAETRILLTEQQPGSETDRPRLVLVVEDVDKAYRKLSREGVVFTKEPAQALWNPEEAFALLRDSEKNIIVIGSQ